MLTAMAPAIAITSTNVKKLPKFAQKTRREVRSVEKISPTSRQTKYNTLIENIASKNLSIVVTSGESVLLLLSTATLMNRFKTKIHPTTKKM
mmetsp:Transcript_31875/g.48417  ORF Transcript_31875/g.48417 Transcript_31875/m.48417 type:complete len:92 (+) Transcript_31875:1716-1991(+)